MVKKTRTEHEKRLHNASMVFLFYFFIFTLMSALSLIFHRPITLFSFATALCFALFAMMLKAEANRLHIDRLRQADLKFIREFKMFSKEPLKKE